MTAEHFLVLQKITLPPAGEWTCQCPGWTMVRIAEGSGYCLQMGSARELDVGDGFISPSTNHVLIRASQLNVMCLQIVEIQSEFLRGLLTAAERLRLEALKRRSDCISYFKANELTGQKFKRLAEQMDAHCLTIRCGFIQLWATCIESLLTVPKPPLAAKENQSLQRIRQLMGLMSDMELFRHSPSELAGQISCSERHFSRLFHGEFGMSFRSHQIELRLQHACRLLNDSSRKILSIANQSGYKNIGLFNQMFKRRFGVTPTEWRRQNSIQQFRDATRGFPSPAFKTER
jgi:AraC-like DNA-binding protein